MNIMNSLKTVKTLLSPLRLHSASSIQIPQSTNRYTSMLPSVYVSPLKLHSATKINLHGVSDSALFRNHLKVRLSPLKSPVLRNSTVKGGFMMNPVFLFLKFNRLVSSLQNFEYEYNYEKRS